MPLWLSLIIVLLIFNAVVFYIGFMTGKWFFSTKRTLVKNIYLVVFIVLANSFLFGTMSDMVILRASSSYWMALFYILFITVPVLHVVVYLTRFTRLKRAQAEKWAGWLTLFAVVVIMIYGTYNAYSPVVRTFEVDMNHENTSPKQLNIVMVADTHFGFLSGKDHAAKMVEEINKLKPDIVLIAGDIIDDSVDEYNRQGMDEIISNIQSTYGVYASLGNHDLGDIPELINILENSKMTVLYDETIKIDDSFTLVGRKDKTDKGRLPLSELMKNVDQSKPVILLDHQPYGLDIAEGEGVDLLVSGHTHRGQLAPFHLFTQHIYENDWGHLQTGELHSIVTSGYGFWGPPIRTNSRSEIVQIQLSY